MATFSVTYDVVTHESAEHGDYSEAGFYSPGGWKHEDRSVWTLGEIVREYGGRLEDNGRWFSTIDAEQDIHDGSYTSFAVHPPDSITASSYKRVKRLLGIR